MATATNTEKALIPQRLKGKVALVTGGSRGIGAAIAQRLAKEGATVAISYSKSQEAADKVVAQLKEEGVSAYAFKADAACQKDTAKLVDDVVAAAGNIDILVNNAGVFTYAPVQDIKVENYDDVFDVNVKGVVATTAAALKKMNDGGRIINISSGVARVTIPGYSLYSATKAALDTLTRVWAQDLGARKITVNGVAPGATDTDMMRAGLTPEMQAAMSEKTALGRLGEPEDIANVVAFLASCDGGWVTGQTIAADGGINI